MAGVIQYRPLDQLAIILGIGATAARHALDVEIGVRIPDPQLNPRKGIFLFLLYVSIGMRHMSDVAGARPDEVVGLILFNRMGQPANRAAQGENSQPIALGKVQQTC